MLHTAFTPYEEFLVEYVRNPGRNDMKVQHYHDTYEFYLQMAGERTLILNDICYTLRPGDLYILKPFEIHYTESRGSDYYERYVINLPASFLYTLLTEGETRLLLDKLRRRWAAFKERSSSAGKPDFWQASCCVPLSSSFLCS